MICDAIIAPDFEQGTLEILRQKRGGKFLIFQASADLLPTRHERRDILGVTLEQERDDVDVTEVLSQSANLSARQRNDALLGMVTARYTQSNSVVLVRNGATVGVGAGQQNRVDCVRLAGAKTTVWWLRRHQFVRALPMIDGMRRQDRLNWQIRFAGHEMTRSQLAMFGELFGEAVTDIYADPIWREEWLLKLSDVTLVSDGYLPFKDNIEFAAEFGVTTVIEPGGSNRTPEIVDATAEFAVKHVQTGLRLFHH